MKIKYLILLFVFNALCSESFAEDLAESDDPVMTTAYSALAAVKIQEMQDDLGKTAELQLQNIGKIQKCAFRGTKLVSVTIKNDVTTYTGNYNNCYDNKITRDGIYNIVAQGDNILSYSEARSVNGKLFDAVIENNFNKAKELIQNKADVNYSESRELLEGIVVEEWSPLMTAVVENNLKMVRLLVKSGAWVNYMNSTATNPFWLAASVGNLEIMKFLASNNAYIENQNAEGMTPLMIAAAKNNYAAVKYLIESKVNLNCKHVDGDTALMFALSRGNSKIAEQLIEAGADLDIQNKFGVTALIIAATENNQEIARKLIEKNADHTLKISGGKTAFDIATFRGHTQIAEMIKQAKPAP